jgi:hypothetical protein
MDTGRQDTSAMSRTALKIVRVLMVMVLMGLGAVSGPGVVQARGSQLVAIDDPNGVEGTDASGINAAGDIVGYYTDGADGIHGFLLRHG